MHDQDLASRWRQFRDVTLDPWTLVLCAALIALFNAPANSEKTYSSIVFVLITLTSTLLGARLTNQWAAITDGGVLRARGKSAVRSLKLLLRYVGSMEKRVDAFRRDQALIETNPEVTMTCPQMPYQ